jgi:hypothetical protein
VLLTALACRPPCLPVTGASEGGIRSAATTALPWSTTHTTRDGRRRIPFPHVCSGSDVGDRRRRI